MSSEECIRNFCQNLRHLRKVNGMKQRQMAKILGISVNTLSKMENCVPGVRIHAAHVCKVCDYFHMSTDEILFENWPEILAERQSFISVGESP